MEYTYLQRTNGLQQTFLHVSAHTHDLTGSFHLGAQRVIGIIKFIKGESGHLGDHIVQCRLKGSQCIGKRNLIQPQAYTDLGGNSGDGVSAGLRGKG